MKSLVGYSFFLCIALGIVSPAKAVSGIECNIQPGRWRLYDQSKRPVDVITVVPTSGAHKMLIHPDDTDREGRVRVVSTQANGNEVFVDWRRAYIDSGAIGHCSGSVGIEPSHEEFKNSN